MSWWSDLTNPINKALNSNTFKAIFPVQALAQGLTQKVSGLGGINNGRGLNPSDQYAIGGGVGSILGGGSALMGGSSGAAGGGAGPSSTSTLQNMRMMPMGGSSQQPQQQQEEDPLQLIYRMYPMLRPNIGGFNGS